MKEKQEKIYDQTSISALKGADRVRKRPGVIFGSANIDGCVHSIFEILSNSVDEAKEGYGKKIILKYKNDGEVTVTDYGRGIPLDWNAIEKRFNWELVFCELYAGGKYGGENYGNSLGLNGLGACATQYASEYMHVDVTRDGYHYLINFAKGEVLEPKLIKEPTDETQTGTTICFKPDIEVFDEIIADTAIFKNMLRQQAMLHKGITFNLELEGEEPIDYYYENGFIDYMEETVEKKIAPIYYKTAEMVGRDREDKPEYKVEMEMVFTFTRENPSIEFYHNSSNLEHGGVHAESLKKAVTSAFTTIIKNNKDFKNLKIKYQDVEDIFACIVSTASPGELTQYENQTKKAVYNEFIKTALATFIEHAIVEWSFDNAEVVTKVLKEVEINKKTREASEATRSKIFKELKSDNFTLGNMPKKFVNCLSQDPTQRELYIVEGE